MHDPRIGRFFAIDPLAWKYVHYSTYGFSGNKVIHRVEIEGLEDGSHYEARHNGQHAVVNSGTHSRVEAHQIYEEAFNRSRPLVGVKPWQVALATVVVVEIFVTKGWLSRSVVLAAVGQNINAHDRYYEAIQSGDEVSAAKYKAEIEETGVVIVLGVLGELAPATISFVTRRIKQGGWTMNQVDKFKYNIDEFGEDIATKYAKGEISREQAIYRSLSDNGKIDPNKVRFSQNSIKSTFRDGKSVSGTTKGLKDGSIKANDIKPIRIVEKDGQIYTLDNRRLKAFQDAGVEIKYTKVEYNASKHKRYFSTENEGTSIEIR